MYLYVAPEKSQAKNIIWKDPSGLFKFLPPELIKKKNEVELTVYFKHTVTKTPGSVFYIEGADNIDRMRGLKPRGIILDEYAQIKRELWTEVLFPAINQSGGWVIFIGTFKGKNHFYDLFSKYYDWGKQQSIPNTDYATFYLPYYENPFFTEDQIRAAKETMPEAQFDQEYGCVPLSGTSNVFPSLTDLMTGELEEPNPTHLYSMGIDLASKQDYTAVSIIDRNTHKLVFQERWQGEWEPTMVKLLSIKNRYNKAHVTIDSTGVGDPISEALKRRGMGQGGLEDFKFSNQSKDRLIKKLGLYFSEKKLILPPQPQIENLAFELEQFTYEILPSGKIRYSAPAGKHDDEVYSLALATWFLKDQPTQDTYSTYVPPHKEPQLDAFA